MEDLLGKEVSMDKYFSDSRLSKPKRTLKEKFRISYGYKEGYFCKNCAYFGSYEQSKKWYKCDRLGRSHSQATDVRKKDVACNLYKAENEV